MVNFVRPNLLGTRKEFSNRFVNPITNGQHADSTDFDVTLMKRRAHVLHEMLAGCVQVCRAYVFHEVLAGCVQVGRTHELHEMWAGCIQVGSAHVLREILAGCVQVGRTFVGHGQMSICQSKANCH